MKHVYLIILLLAATHIQAQNFEPVREGATHYYNATDISGIPSTEIISIKLDSTIVVAGQPTFYCNPILRFTTGLDVCLLPAFLGSKYVTLGPGNYCILKTENPVLSSDSLFLFTNSSIGAEWIFNKQAENALWWAHVDDKTLEPVLGAADSVLTFSIYLKDSDNVIISHDLNGYQFKLSKTYGLIQSTDLFTFPESTAITNLVGTSLPYAGVFIPNTDSIFNFEINDEFHYDYVVTDHFYYSHALITFKLTDKSIFGDTLQLTWLENSYETKQNYMSFDTTYISDSTIISKIPMSVYLGLNTPQLIPQEDNFTEYGASVFHTTQFNPDFGYTHKVNYDYDFTESENCTEYLNMSVQSYEIYAAHVGLYQSYGTNGLEAEYDYQLVYYKNKYGTWGEPLTVPTATQEFTNQDIQLVNTLVENNLFIQVTNNIQQATITIYDVTGKKVLEENNINLLSGETAIPVGYLSSGTYYLCIRHYNGVENVQFVKTRH
ncbi:MAG: T9SS type A sorting domain-containing protein [Bacteroidetes bacterium]|nr:T9SS type A sorting domain-containing protein [Bacteroidota bacterium]